MALRKKVAKQQASNTLNLRDSNSVPFGDVIFDPSDYLALATSYCSLAN